MKKISGILLTSFLLLSAFSLTQHAYAGDGTHPSALLAKCIELSGKVSDDEKVFTADDDNTWRISNTELVKGLAGRYVTVKCRMDVNKRAIRVLAVQDPENTHSARLGDAAFRR